MYPISDTAKALYDKNARQVILIRMDTENDTYNLTENDIIAGSFSIDRYSITGSKIEIGTACAGECKFKIKNFDGRWNGVRFEGAQLYIRIGIADWTVPGAEGNIIWMPCGYFIVDRPAKNASILSIEALDRMAKFDKPVDWDELDASYNPRTLISRLCEICDVTIANGAAMAQLPNANYSFSTPKDVNNLTYRNLLQYACMLLGACAYINENGSLVIKWYTQTTVTIDESKRYNHEIHENNVTVTGVIFVDTSGEEDVEYLSGTKDYAIDISDNILIQDNKQTVVNNLGTALNGFTYRPYRATVKPSPYLYPTDMITFVKNNVSYTGIVSNVTYGINCNTALEGKGETEEDKGYATYGTLTNVQSKVAEYAKQKVEQQIDERTTMLLNLNEMIMNSLGLYETTLQTQSGYQYYFHDARSLLDSTIIYTFNANGFAWTDDWNDGNPVWHYGITRDGNAVINMLSAYKISADVITAGTMQSVNLIFGQTPNTTELRTNDAQTGALFDGSGVMQFRTNGEFLVRNSDTQSAGNYANIIRSAAHSSDSAGDYNILYGYNYRAGSLANYMQLKAYSDRSFASVANNAYGTTDLANRIQLSSTSSGTTSLYQNFNSGGSEANRVDLGSTSSQNYAQLANYDASGTRVNYVYLSHAKSSSQNSLNIRNLKNATYSANNITLDYAPNATTPKSSLLLRNYGVASNALSNSLELSNISTKNEVKFSNYKLSSGNEANNLTLSGESGATSLILNNYSSVSTNIANCIELKHTSSEKRIFIKNYDGTSGAYANYFLMDNGSYPYARLVNFQQGNTSTGYVASSIYLKQTSTINSFDFYNNKKSTTTSLEEASGNHLAMYTYSTNSSSVFRVDNYHWNGNLGNQLEMGSYNNSSSFALRNYNDSGVARSWLTMSGDGTLELGGNTGGTSRLTLNSNGNLDLVGRNVAYVAASSSIGYVAIKTKNVEKICEWVDIDGNGNYFLKGVNS